jgi:hypothetical protein
MASHRPENQRAMFPICPKCRHDLAATTNASTCPACGLVFAKFLAAERGEPVRRMREPESADEDAMSPSLAARLLAVPERVNAQDVYARMVLFAVITLWGWSIAAMDIRDGGAVGSIIHLTYLPFHEAGHVIFMLSGSTFLIIAGGTLMQLIVPIVLGVALHRKNNDNFGASIALWWLAASFIDCAPYAYDALDPKLTLLGGSTGAESGGHDWMNMLGDLGIIRRAHGVGRLLHVIGIVLMLAANAWGIAVLLRQYRNRTDAPMLD